MKISVIMQVYLGSYPGSRTFAREKFVRAINSFLAQTHPDKELVIVADGCVFAKKIYKAVYSNNPLVKFAWIAPPQQKMYEQVQDGKTYYRGYPKSVGVQHATGDIICYLDSDDILLPSYLFTLHSFWLEIPLDIKWASNTLRVVNLKLLGMEDAAEYKNAYSDHGVDLSPYGITEDFFVNVCVPLGKINAATYNLSHRRDISVEWKDTVEMNEDIVFVKTLQETHGAGVRLMIPGYVVCHYRAGWDC
jgi:glycosyltransferase involved in cell wall biosynthesis